MRDVEQDRVAAGAVDLLVEIGELRGHARIDLDDRDHVGLGVVHHLDIEQAVIEAEPRHQGRGNIGHAPLHVLGQGGGVIEAREGERARKHHRVDDADDGGLSAVNKTFDGHLLAREQPLGDEPLGADPRAGVALKHLIEGREELIERRPAREERGKRRGLIDTLGADREKGFHGLDEEREA